MSTSAAVDLSIDGEHIDHVPATAALSQWLWEHDIWLHPKLTIQPLGGGLDENGSEGTGDQRPRPLGVFLSPSSSPLPFPSGTPIALIPKTACLSPRTSALRSHLATLDIDPVFGPQATSGLLLSFCLLYEQRLGESSAFHGYVRSLPRERPGGQFGIRLSLERGENAQTTGDTVLQGTETARILQRAELRARDPATSPGWPSHSSDAMSLSLLRHFYTQTVLPFFTNLDPVVSKTLPEDIWSDFKGSYSLVSSRAFVCDTYHGLALVPLADIFNHAEPPEEGEEDAEVQQHVQFECEDLVCTRCGSLTDSENGRCKKRCNSLDQQETSRCEKERMGDDDGDDDDDNLIYMTTIVPLYASPTQPLEILNNYGPLSPARLLASYGFVAQSGPVNRWERYCWDWRSCVERTELLAALGLYQEQEAQYPSRKRAHDARDTGDTSIANDRSSGGRHRWSHLVCTLIASGAESTEALFPSSEPIHTSPGDSPPARASRLLPLPKQSPFHLMDIRTEEEENFSDFLVSPSADDGEYTADEVLPLFIDGRGRASRPLWTICVLAALVRHTSPGGQVEWSKDELLQLLRGVEARAEEILAKGARTGEAVRPTSAKEEHALQSCIISSAASMLHTLVQARRESIATLAARVEAPAPEGDSLRSSAVRLAHKERLVLLETLQKIDALLSAERTSDDIIGRDSIAFERGNAE